MNQFGQCCIGSEVFDLAISLWHVKNSFILANFIMDNEQVDWYPGQVQFYFNHIVNFTNGQAKHNLAYVRWYRRVNSTKTRYYFSVDDDDETCNVKLWKSDFYSESHDCIILIHNILFWFILSKFKISEHSNTVKYLAINPVNRKIHIR